ncbi:MAG TPA: DUF3313 family protein [Steroidobacteraceae bacterium]|nr:DUF3313 family protein [Steroidobacteraceae bacterium]
MARAIAAAGTRLTAVVGLAVFVAGCATQGPAESWDGLVLRPESRLDAVYVQPGVDFPAYRSVIIDPLEVSFDKNWDPNRDVRSVSRQLDERDIEAIRTGLAELFLEVFREELAKGGYSVVSTPGPETLHILPAVTDLYINAPDRMEPGRTTTYTTETGRMTLVAELRDSVSGDVLARVVDRQQSRDSGMMQVTNRVTNTADARRAIGVWARALREGLDELKGR